jgi:hypothetical protein
MDKHVVAGLSRALLSAAFVAAPLLLISAARADEESQIKRGFEIAPVELKLAGKHRALVGLGSYLVNTTGCNDCHTYPNWAQGGNPFKGEPEQINTKGYLAGGRDFGVAISPNITPDDTGKPAGLTLKEFLHVMRTGEDPDHSGRLLQVMPWPLYQWKTDRDLTAIYEYLRAIPQVKPPSSIRRRPFHAAWIMCSEQPG